MWVPLRGVSGIITWNSTRRGLGEGMVGLLLVALFGRFAKGHPFLRGNILGYRNADLMGL